MSASRRAASAPLDEPWLKEGPPSLGVGEKIKEMELRLGKGAGLKIVAALGKEKGSAVASKELLDHVDKSSGEYSFASVADAKVGYGGTTWRKHGTPCLPPALRMLLREAKSPVACEELNLNAHYQMGYKKVERLRATVVDESTGSEHVIELRSSDEFDFYSMK